MFFYVLSNSWRLFKARKYLDLIVRIFRRQWFTDRSPIIFAMYSLSILNVRRHGPVSDKEMLMSLFTTNREKEVNIVNLLISSYFAYHSGGKGTGSVLICADEFAFILDWQWPVAKSHVKKIFMLHDFFFYWCLQILFPILFLTNCFGAGPIYIEQS